MHLKLFWFLGLTCLILSKVNCSTISNEGDISISDDWESETPTTFYNIVDGNELEKKFNSDVDEELIRKAEAVAEKDLLNGLNMILKNNETLEDVLRMEEAEEFS